MRLRDRLNALKGEAVLGLLLTLRALSKPSRQLRRAYHALLIRLVKRTGLFDRAYYLESNADVERDGTPPLRHYVELGDRQNRAPMAFFESAEYRTRIGGRTKDVNALLHYAYVGRYRRYSPSAWFDVDYYLSNNKDVARAGIEPLSHFLNWGGTEGRAPSPNFDSDYYLRANPEVAQARMNPLIHYLLYGRLRGRSPLPPPQGEDDVDHVAPGPLLPSTDAWNALERRANLETAKVDVVVPVYKGRTETLRCLYTVLSAATSIPFELVVINDNSPESELAEELSALASRGLFTLLVNPVNRGFVYTANRGMRLHLQRDVVLLNSDTEVFDGWLDRLRSAAQRNAFTATVTPLSNNATICSYPRFLHDNPCPLELSYAELDALAERVNGGVEVESPTGVGFCMYVKRACMDDIGFLDEEAFGRGYGEENDFCQRASRKGWRNVIVADVFVRHWGATSFRGEKAERLEESQKVLKKRHPLYARDVAEFIRLDPLKSAREALDWARMKRVQQKVNVLIVCHTRGGGTERHVQEDIRHLTEQGYGVFLMRPVAANPSHVVIRHPTIRVIPNLRPVALADTESLKSRLEQIGITEIHTHSLVDFAKDAPTHLVNLVRSLDVRWEANLHDYKVICPRINLADEHGHYCGEPDLAACERCLSTRGSSFGTTDIRAWRAMHRSALLSATRVLVPDIDVASRLNRYFADIRFEVSPHEEVGLDKIPPTLPTVQPSENLRVVVVGAIGKLKGFNVLLACAEYARRNDVRIEFTLMGYSMNDRLLQEAGVAVTGKYRDEYAVEKLKSLNPHVVWLPSVWPETYSYTLSIALQASMPVVAFDIGAIARRLKEIGGPHRLLPLEMAAWPGKLVSVFNNISNGKGFTGYASEREERVSLCE